MNPNVFRAMFSLWGKSSAYGPEVEIILGSGPRESEERASAPSRTLVEAPSLAPSICDVIAHSPHSPHEADLSGLREDGSWTDYREAYVVRTRC